MLLLHLRGVHQGLMVVEDRLREARRARGEIDRRIVLVSDQDARIPARAVGCKLRVVLRKGRACIAVEEQQTLSGDPVRDLLDAADKLLAEDENIAVRLIHAVLDLVGCVAEIERYRKGSGLQDAEIDRQPLKAVHEKNTHLVILADTALKKQVRKTVCLLVEDTPGDLTAVWLGVRRLNQVILSPGDSAVIGLRRVDLDKSAVFRV